MSVPSTHLEWVPFRPAAGVTESQLLAAADALHTDFLAASTDYLRRMLLRDENGAYVDCVAWRSRADHAAAMRDATNHPAAQALFALIDDPEAVGAGMRHFDVARQWP